MSYLVYRKEFESGFIVYFKEAFWESYWTTFEDASTYTQEDAESLAYRLKSEVGEDEVGVAHLVFNPA